MEIEDMPMQEESETWERKPSLADRDRIVELVCSFANRKGGTILVGVSDEGEVKGTMVGKSTIEGLTDLIVDNTDPKIYPEIDVLEVDAKKVIAVRVKESTNKPHLAFGKAFIRVGKNTKQMSRDEYERMLSEGRQRFDSEISDASMEDIDWDFVSTQFIPRYEQVSETNVAGSAEVLLEALDCVKEGKPTNAGVLLFGKTPQKYFMNAYIALARYKGKAVGGERLDYKEFGGNLFQQIDACDRYIKEHVAVMSRMHPMQVEREDIPEYPFFTLRELIVNAVCHRDYSTMGSKVIVKMFEDHIECYNPGGLQPDITPENITEKQFSRNQTIAKVLSKVRYIEEVGEGWDKIIKEHKKHPLKPKMPKISADAYTFLVTLFSTKEKFVEERKLVLSKRQNRIMKFIDKESRITTSMCAALLGISNDTALRELQKLKSMKLITQKGAGRTIYYTCK